MMGNNEGDFSKFMRDLDESLEGKKSRSKDPREKLVGYKILLGGVVFWKSRQSYFEIIKSFLNEEIGGEEFQSQFLNLRSGNMRIVTEICEKIEEGTEPIPDFYYTSKSVDFNSALDNLFFAVDEYGPEIDDSESSE